MGVRTRIDLGASDEGLRERAAQAEGRREAFFTAGLKTRPSETIVRAKGSGPRGLVGARLMWGRFFAALRMTSSAVGWRSEIWLRCLRCAENRLRWRFLRGEFLDWGVVVLFAAYGAVVLFCGFEKFEAAVGGVGFYAVAQRLHFGGGHGLEIASNFQILFEDAEVIHSADGGGHRQAHGVAQTFGGRDGAAGDHFAGAAQALHAQDADAALVSFRQHLLFEAAKSRVESVQRHLHGVEREILFKHSQVDGRIFVAGEADEADFSLLLRGGERFGGTARREN